MPYPNYHAARLADPKDFDHFTVEKTGKGLMLILGWLPDGKSKVQSVRFRASRWSPKEARKWLREHDYKPISFEKATGESTSGGGDELEKSISGRLRRDSAPDTAGKRYADNLGGVRSWGVDVLKKAGAIAPRSGESKLSAGESGEVLSIRLRSSARSFVRSPWSYVPLKEVRETVSGGGTYRDLVESYASMTADDEVSSLSWASKADGLLKYARSLGGIQPFHDLVVSKLIEFVAELNGVTPDKLCSVAIPPEPTSASTPFLP